MNIHFLNKRLVHQLGFAGLIPFAALCLACWLVDPEWLGVFIKNQLAYGILILSFLGGVHWGATIVATRLTLQQSRRALLWSVTPSLIGWLATMVGGFGFALLIAGFIAAYQADKRLFAWYDLPDWFIDLRLKLTCVVVAALVLTVVAANVRG
jgi:hypothetical protein